MTDLSLPYSPALISSQYSFDLTLGQIWSLNNRVVSIFLFYTSNIFRYSLEFAHFLSLFLLLLLCFSNILLLFFFCSFSLFLSCDFNLAFFQCSLSVAFCLFIHVSGSAITKSGRNINRTGTRLAGYLNFRTPDIRSNPCMK